MIPAGAIEVISVNTNALDSTVPAKQITVKVTERSLYVKVRDQVLLDVTLSFSTVVPASDETFWQKKNGWVVVTLTNVSDDVLYLVHVYTHIICNSKGTHQIGWFNFTFLQNF